MRQTTILLASCAENISAVHNKLRDYGMTIFRAKDIGSIKVGLALHSPTFVLLDFDITGANSLLNEIAFGQYIPQPYIIIAAAYADGNDRAAMLRRGADYCIDNPINAHEALAVIDTVLRRNRQRDTIEYKELTINTSRQSVTMRGVPVILTRKEYQVLSLLVGHAGMILAKEEIYRAVWKTEYDPKSTNVSDQISSPRSKLGPSSKDKDYIRTVIGVGYCFGNIK